MLRRTPLAFKNLTHNLARTIVSIGGVMLAIVLMFMQLGFLGAVGDTATVIYQRMPMDLVVRSPDYLHLFEPDSIDDSIALALRSLPEVRDVRPIDTGLGAWSNPRTRETRSIAVIGLQTDIPAVITEELQGKLPRLTSSSFVMVDRESSAEFVPEPMEPSLPSTDLAPVENINLESQTFGPQHIWATAECNGHRVRIVETFRLGTGLAASGALITDRNGFQRLFGGMQAGRASMLLLRVSPNVSTSEAKRAVSDQLRFMGLGSVQVLTRRETMQRETFRWYFETPIGMIFLMGVAVAVVVGSVICYMVLAGEVLANLAEYATLKAVGYSNRFLGGVLLQQSILIALAAFIPAILVSLGLYWVTSRAANIPIEMTFARVILVGILSVLMCMVAGLIALKKLAKAEPASLF